MKPPFTASLATLIVACTLAGAAADDDVLPRLDQALKAGVTYEYGKDAQPLRTIEQIVIAAVQIPAQRTAVEQRLLDAFRADPTRDAQEFFCRQLFIVGTPNCIPQLEALLPDPGVGHMARYVLGRLEYPEALAALHRALAKTSGTLQVGVATTLGERRCAAAIPDLAKLLTSTEPALAAAAANALGKIGGTDALKALEAARPNAPEPLAFEIDDARLAVADRLLVEGQDRPAAAVYLQLYAPTQPQRLRIAALRGLVSLPNADALPMLVDAIKGTDQDLAASAIHFSAAAKGAEVTRALATLLPTLPPGSQALLLAALGSRGDRTALPAVTAAARSGPLQVRVAALEALGTLGDGSAVDLLVRAAARSAEAAAARASLARLEGADVNEALVKTLASGDDPARVEACRALAKRKANSAFPVLLRQAQEANAAVREAAIRALGDLASGPDLAALTALLLKPNADADRPAIEASIESTFRRVPNSEAQAQPLLAALPTASVDAQPALLRLLGRAATPGAFTAVRGALKSESPAVRDTAVRVLADWPDAAAAEDLLMLANSLTDPTLKLIALRGYVRLAGTSNEATAMYARAMDLARRPEDQRLVLAGLGTATSPEALALVERYLDQETLRAEAGLAAVQIADRVRHRDAARARSALNHVLAGAKDPTVRQKAIDLLNEVDQYADHLLDWLAAGPYKQEGKDAEALFGIPFPPEQPNAPNVAWKKLTQGIGSWDINLDQAIGSGDDIVAYARTRVWSPTAQEARLELGSDDAIKVWLNGQVVHANYTNRGLGPRQDRVKVQLAEGWNELRLKIVNRSGGWGFACRVRQADGTALPGLKVQPE